MAATDLSRSGAITGINVTPLVDVTLVLLIIFMVTARMITRREAIPLDLPTAATGGEVQEIFGIVVPAHGPAQVNGVPLTDDADLVRRARAALAQNASLRATLQADGAVPHRQVMHLLDLLRQAGLARIAFGVVPVPADSP